MLIGIQGAELHSYICYLAPWLIAELLMVSNVCHSEECQDQSGKDV